MPRPTYVEKPRSTPTPTRVDKPTTPTPSPTVNPSLIGHCCSPGKCNTVTTPTAVSAKGVTTGSASDCAQFFLDDGDRRSTADWAECKTQSGCTNAQNSCGGNSGTVYVPGEWCSASSKPGQCCPVGQCSKAGTKCLGAVPKFPSGTVDSSDWGECQFKTGCEDKQGACGGSDVNGNIAAQWCSGTEPDTTPTSPKGQTQSHDKKKSSGGLSGGAIAGIVIAAIVVLGVAGFMMQSNNAEPEHDDYHKAADGTYAPPR